MVMDFEPKQFRDSGSCCIGCPYIGAAVSVPFFHFFVKKFKYVK